MYEDVQDPGAFYSIQTWQDAVSFKAHMSDAREGMSDAREGMADATAMLREAPRTAVLRTIG